MTSDISSVTSSGNVPLAVTSTGFPGTSGSVLIAEKIKVFGTGRSHGPNLVVLRSKCGEALTMESVTNMTNTRIRFRFMIDFFVKINDDEKIFFFFFLPRL